MLNWPSFATKNKPKGRPVDENMAQSFEVLCIWLEVETDAERYTVTELHKKNDWVSKWWSCVQYQVAKNKP